MTMSKRWSMATSVIWTSCHAKGRPWTTVSEEKPKGARFAHNATTHAETEWLPRVRLHLRVRNVVPISKKPACIREVLQTCHQACAQGGIAQPGTNSEFKGS